MVADQLLFYRDKGATLFLMSVRKKQTSKNLAYQLAKPIPSGTILSDVHKRKWIVGSPIAQGGFGCIYSVRLDNELTEQYVAKIEPQENGPLFTEIHFYVRVCTEDSISKWKSEHRKAFLGIPRYVSSGHLHRMGHTSCRFLVMDRFTGDFESVLKRGLVKPQCVLTVAVHVLDALEYLHFKDYAHADIKASNLLYSESYEKVTLVDFGLIHLFRSGGVHCAAKPNPKFKHNGTLEFCSRDSHAALPPSRRGDLEILLFNLVHWLARCRSGAAQSHLTGLPWGHLISDPKLRQNVPERVKLQVADLKEQAMRDLQQLIRGAGIDPDPNFVRFAQSIARLGYDETPDYAQLRQCLTVLSNRVSPPGSTKRCTTGHVPEVISKQPCPMSPTLEQPSTTNELSKTTKPRRGRPPGTTSKIRKPHAAPPNEKHQMEYRGAKPANDDGHSKSSSPLPTRLIRSPATHKCQSLASYLSSPRNSTAVRSSPRLNPVKSATFEDVQINSPRLQTVFDSDEDDREVINRSTAVAKVLGSVKHSSRKVLTPLNPHSDASPTNSTVDSRRSGFCQTSPELLLLAKAEALGRRAAEMASRHVYTKR